LVVLWIRRSKVRILPRQPSLLAVGIGGLPTTTSGGFVSRSPAPRISASKAGWSPDEARRTTLARSVSAWT
jgi:hypothetical protein